MFQDKIIHQTYKIHFIIRIIVTIIYSCFEHKTGQ